MTSNAAQDRWVLQVLNIDVGGGDAGVAAEMDEVDIDLGDMWQGAREDFQAATEAVDAQIDALKAALLEDDDLEMQEIGEQLADAGLNAVTGNTRVPLMAALMEAGDGTPERLRKAAPKIEAAAQAFLAVLASDRRVAACDDNDLGVDVSIHDTYSEAIDSLLLAVRLAQRGG